MEVIKKYIINHWVVVIVGALAAIASVEVQAMRMSPEGAQRAKAFLARPSALKPHAQENYPVVPKVETLKPTANIGTMYMTEMGKKSAKAYLMRMQQKMPTSSFKTEAEKKQELGKAFFDSDADYAIAQQVEALKPGNFFIHEAGTANGIVVPWDTLQKSRTMKTMVEDLEAENGQIAIPITAYSIDTIQLVFNALSLYTNPNDKNKLLLDNFKNYVTSLSLEQLVEMANAFDFFDVPQDMLIVVLESIKKNSEIIGSNDVSKILSPDLQKWLMVEPAVSYLKYFIIKKYVNRRKIEIKTQQPAHFVTFSPDDNYIASVSQGPLVLWDIRNPYKVTYQELPDYTKGSNVVAFSPDGKKIAIGRSGMVSNLIVLDISNLNNITYTILKGHKYNVSAIAFSPDGTTLVSVSSGSINNLIVWDVNDLNNITKEKISTYLDAIYSVAFGSDSKHFVVGGSSKDNQSNLEVWYIKNNLSTIINYRLSTQQGSIRTVAFNLDAKKIVTGSADAENNLVVWDISTIDTTKSPVWPGHIFKLDPIAQQPLIDPNVRFIDAVTFNSDGTNIISLGQETRMPNPHSILTLWNITNPNHIVSQQLSDSSFNATSALALSHNDKYIVSGSRSWSNFWGSDTKLILWPLLTDQERTLLNQLKNYNVDQVRLVYQLCLQSLKGQVITLKQGSDEQIMFMTLPRDMQQLLTDILDIKGLGWFSGW